MVALFTRNDVVGMAWEISIEFKNESQYKSSDDSDEYEEGTNGPGRLSLKRRLTTDESDEEDDIAGNKENNHDDGFDTDSESDEDDDDEEDEEDQNEENDLCPICLGGFEDQMIGIPENCNHMFCSDCIQEWTKNVNNCPVDRKKINLIHVHSSKKGPIVKKIPVEDNILVAADFEDPPTYCQVCNQCDREETLLLCDGCDNGFHMNCLTPALSSVPSDEWFCANCQPPDTDQPSTSRGKNSSADSNNDRAARNLMFGQLSRPARPARTASTVRNQRRTPTRQTTPSPSPKKKKKKGAYGRVVKKRKRKDKGKAKRKHIDKELKEFRKKHAARTQTGEEDGVSNKDISVRGVAVFGHNFDLDGYFNDDDEDFCYDDEKIDNTPRSTLCDTADVIGNILGGFDTLNPDNVTVLRDGTLKQIEKRTTVTNDNSEESSSVKKKEESSSSPELKSKKQADCEMEHSRALTKENKKRRKIRFLDDGNDNDSDEEKAKLNKQLHHGYQEALRKKQKAKELQDEIDRVKRNALDTDNVNHQASLLSVKSFKIPKKVRKDSGSSSDVSANIPTSISSTIPSVIEIQPTTSPLKSLSRSNNTKISACNVSSSNSSKSVSAVNKKNISSSNKTSSSSSPHKDTKKISNVINLAKKAISSTKSTNNISSSGSETFVQQSQRLALVVDSRRNHVPEVKKKIHTLEEKISLHHAGKLKNKSHSPKRRNSSSSSNETSGKEQRQAKPTKLKSIMRVQAEPTCRGKPWKPMKRIEHQNTRRTQEIPRRQSHPNDRKPVDYAERPQQKKLTEKREEISIKKPISLKDYKERKLMEDLFGEPEPDKNVVPKKTVTFKGVKEEEKEVKKDKKDAKDRKATKPDGGNKTKRIGNDQNNIIPLCSLDVKNNLKGNSDKASNRILTSPEHSNVSSMGNTFSNRHSQITSTTTPNPFGALLLRSHDRAPPRPLLDLKHKPSTVSTSSIPPIPVGVVSPRTRADLPPKEKQRTEVPVREKKTKDHQETDALSKEEYITRVKNYMKPLFQKGTVNKEQWKSIVKQAVDKIRRHPGFYSKDENITKLLEGLLASVVGAKSVS